MTNDSSESGIGAVRDHIGIFAALKNLLMSNGSGKAIDSMGSLSASNDTLAKDFDVPEKPTISDS